MRIYPFTLFLFLLLSFKAFSYEVVIEGIVMHPTPGTNVAGIEILIQSLPDDTFQYEAIVVTTEDGTFRHAIDVPDDVRGTFLVYPVACPTSDHTKRVVYHPDHHVFEVKIKACDSDRDCRVTIKQRYHDDGTLYLVAKPHGTAPFTYEWSDGSTSETIAVGAAGKYCVIVTDAEGCTADACYEIDRACKSEILVRAPGLNTTSDARAILIVESKGVAPFTYEWSTGETTKEIKVLDYGEYCVRVVDANGCVSEDCIVIDDEGCMVNISVLDANSDAASNGLLLKARVQGKAPFTYMWSTGDTTMNIRVTEAGQYCVRVEDATGCVSESCIEVDPAECKTEIARHPLTNSQAATLHLQAKTRGLAPFSYVWSTGDSTKNIRVSASGTYCVQVTDRNGCVSEDCIDVEVPNLCAVSIDAKPTALDVTNVQAFTLHARTQGKAPFVYQWISPNGEVISEEPTLTVDDLTTYCVVVTDSNGCVSDACINLEEVVTECKVEIHRTGSGLLIAFIRSYFPYTILWNTGSTDRKIKIDGPGEYCVTIISASGCTATACIVIDEEEKCKVKIHREKTASGATALIAKTRSDHTFTYEWNTGDSTQSIVPDSSGEYCVTVTDNAGCVSDACITYHLPSAVSPFDLGFETGLTSIIKATLSPNPFVGQLQISLDLSGRSDARVLVYDLSGQLVKEKTWNQVSNIHETMDLENLHAGMYLVKIVTESENKTLRLIKSD